MSQVESKKFADKAKVAMDKSLEVVSGEDAKSIAVVQGLVAITAAILSVREILNIKK